MSMVYNRMDRNGEREKKKKKEMSNQALPNESKFPINKTHTHNETINNHPTA